MSKDHNSSEENKSSEEQVPSEEQISHEQSEETTEITSEEVEDVLEDATDISEEGVDAVEENVVEVVQEVEEPVEEIADQIEAEAEEAEEAEEGDVFGGDEEEAEGLEMVEEPTEEVNVPENAAAEAAPAVDAPAPVVKVEDTKKWYSLRVISGKERKIKERIELEISRSKWDDYVTQVLVPSEKVYKIRNGKKVILERNILPGYILIEAEPANFTGEMVQAIANIPNVIHFLGKNNPTPMRSSEANRMLGKVDESQSLGEAMIEPFIVGETVKIIDGPFSEFVGDIQEVNEEKKKMKVIVKIFGRGTEVELNFMQVEKQQ